MSIAHALIVVDLDSNDSIVQRRTTYITVFTKSNVDFRRCAQLMRDLEINHDEILNQS